MKKSNTSRQSGFAIVLVLLLIFLIMVMTITYLRTMRTYNESRQATGVSNAVPVANQLVQDLATIIGADGNLSKNEPHDYPWTCSRMNAPYRLTYPKLFSDTGALGDPLVDDSWLSPCEPDANGKWAQVSNPVGSFIVCTTADMANIGPNFATRDRVPMDAPAGRPVTGVAVDGSGTPQSVPFQMLPVTDPRLVDTDGDGIGDALWFYPKNAWQNGIRYAAAVRVVDLSGMLNINTALGEFASAPDATTGTPRKGEGPYEINASALLGAMPNASKSFRQSAAPVVTVPSGRAPAAWTDWDFWWAAGARTKDDGTSFGSGSTRYSLTDELQLRDYANQFTSNPYPVIRGHYPALESALPAPGGDFSGATRLRVTTISGVADRYAPVPTSPFR